MSRRDGRPWWDAGSLTAARVGIGLGAAFALLGVLRLGFLDDGFDVVIAAVNIMIGAVWFGTAWATRRVRLREQEIEK